MEQQKNGIRFIEPMIHILVWVLFFGFPLLLVTNESSGIDWPRILHHSIVPLFFCIVFYLNYCIFIPKLLFREKTMAWVLLNLALIVFSGVLMQALHLCLAPPEPLRDLPRFRLNPGILFFFRDVSSLALVIGVAVSVQFGRRWLKTENARKEAERGKTEAELKNLRNQLNPHFLFNALNNIYSFIGSDSDHARRSLDSLCELLRYALYRSDRPEVYFREEVSFIRNYIDLAGERLPDDTDLSVELPDPGSETLVAPMLFIVPVENAFKHGVRSGKSSFIHIVLKENDGRIICKVENSCYPDYDSRESRDTGIGLENLHRRLDILYDGHYTFQYGVTDNEKYYSYLEIETM